MEANSILLMNNWRVLHGRAGGRAASSDRHVLVGGTIVREAIYSRAIQLARVLRENKNM
jgi:trimethyllysine dioxygenase